MRYLRKGQKELSVLKNADERQATDKFIPIVIDGQVGDILGIIDVRVRFTNGMEQSQNEGSLEELFGLVKKLLG